MLIAMVVGHVVSTQKNNNLVGCKLLVIAPMGRKDVYLDSVCVAVDAVGAGIGERVLVVRGTAARMVMDKTDAPVDLAIVGIIDTLEISE